LDVDTIFGDLRRECLHQRVVRNTIFRKAPPSVVYTITTTTALSLAAIM
jgi:hypothetical protein